MFMLSRRQCLGALAALAATPYAGLVRAAAYPAKLVKIIVPYPPGAATDALGRLLGQAFEAQFKQSFIVENKGGGATQVGTKAIASADPDGYTLGFIDTSFVINPGLFGAALPYDTQKDFMPVSLTATAPLVLVVHKSVAATDLKSFIALAKSQPNALNYGSAGVGSAPHLAGEQLRRAADIQINHIPYRGGSTVLTDLLAGHIQFGFTTVPTMVEHIRSGAVKAIALTGKSDRLPDVPTFADAGLPAVDATPLFGMIAPARTPADIMQTLSKVASEAVRTGAMGTRLKEMGFTPIGSTAEEFRARIDSEIAKWVEVIRAGDIKPNA